MEFDTRIPVYGKEKPDKVNEDSLQRFISKYIKVAFPKVLFYHVPNGGSRVKVMNKNGEYSSPEAAKLKGMGVLAGVSDIIIEDSRHGFGGMRMELKVKGGRLQDSQIDYLRKAAATGKFICVCYNRDAASDIIRWYLTGTPSVERIRFKHSLEIL